MTKTKYEVRKYGKIIASYVTTTRNCEDMLRILKEKYHLKLDDIFYDSMFTIYRIIDRERTIIYTAKQREFWDN